MKGMILVTGSEGLVGSRFIEISKCKNLLKHPKKVELDITNPDEVRDIISSGEIGAIVNFAAYTDVGKAEEERGKKEGLCWQVNVDGVNNLAQAVKPLGDKIHFIQISTDMVFSGNKDDPGPYTEEYYPEEDLEKLTWYGYTKGRAEKVVRDTLGDNASIVRLIYPVRAHFPEKLDHIRKPLFFYDEGKLYPLFSDQQVSITFIDELCDVLDRIIGGDVHGTFHASSCDTTTPYELISEVVRKVRGKSDPLDSMLLDDFLFEKKMPPYRYPKFGGLSVAITEEKLNFKFSRWREIVEKLVEQGLGKEE